MLLSKLRRTIEENNLLSYGDSVICAVSGGADSVCLLHVMLSLRSEYNLKIYVANVNHLIRGEESDSDSEFVRSISKAADLEFFYREYDVIKIARERKLGEEECGRILRYEFFEELSQKLGGAKIATAHNLNDNAETVIFRLIRGSGAKGLSGIKYSRKNIIRPLLDVTREEIEKYLRSNSISWREDSTNKMPVYARNKIRLNVMEILEEISNGAQRKIVSAAKILSEDNKFIEECAENALSECFISEELYTEKFSLYPSPIKRRIAAYLLNKWNASQITSEKIESFCDFATKETGHSFDINAHFYLSKAYGKISLCKRGGKKDFLMMLDGVNDAVGKDWIISAYCTENYVKKGSNDVALFDADKLSFPLLVRPRRDGDRIFLKGLSGSKLISDIFTDEKVKREERDEIPIVEKDGEVLFVSSLRQSALFSPDENTKKFIVIKYERKNNF